MIDIPVVSDEPLKLEIRHFLECILKNKQPSIDGQGAIEALKIALKAWETSSGKKRFNN